MVTVLEHGDPWRDSTQLVHPPRCGSEVACIFVIGKSCQHPAKLSAAFCKTKNGRTAAEDPDLVKVWHIFVQVVEAHNEGEGGNGHKEQPGDGAHPGAVEDAIVRHVHSPGRQARLVQLQQLLIVLPRVPLPSGCGLAGRKSQIAPVPP